MLLYTNSSLSCPIESILTPFSSCSPFFQRPFVCMRAYAAGNVRLPADTSPLSCRLQTYLAARSQP